MGTGSTTDDRGWTRTQAARRTLGIGGLFAAFLALGLATGCTDTGKVSAEQATQHVDLLAQTADQDAREIRSGLPKGAEQLAQILYAPKKVGGASAIAGVGGSSPSNPSAPSGNPDAETTREALNRARSKVQDLRVAKSTFFAFADPQGVVIRNDQEQDQLAGKSLLGAFPELKNALGGKYVETHGAMPEMAGVRNRADGQWVVAAPVMFEGTERGIFVTGWSWSAYAYRLQFKLRGEINSKRDTTKGEPLVYVAIVVDKAVYAWDASDVVLQSVAQMDPMNSPENPKTVSKVVEITGRTFGIAVKAAPTLGAKVGVAVIRSET